MSNTPLTFTTNLKQNYPSDYLLEICTKYNLTYEITSIHRATDQHKIKWKIKPKNSVRIRFTQTDNDPQKQLAAMYQLGLIYQPFIGTSKSQEKKRQEFIELIRPLTRYNRETQTHDDFETVCKKDYNYLR